MAPHPRRRGRTVVLAELVESFALPRRRRVPVRPGVSVRAIGPSRRCLPTCWRPRASRVRVTERVMTPLGALAPLAEPPPRAPRAVRGGDGRAAFTVAAPTASSTHRAAAPTGEPCRNERSTSTSASTSGAAVASPSVWCSPSRCRSQDARCALLPARFAGRRRLSRVRTLTSSSSASPPNSTSRQVRLASRKALRRIGRAVTDSPPPTQIPRTPQTPETRVLTGKLARPVGVENRISIGNDGISGAYAPEVPSDDLGKPSSTTDKAPSGPAIGPTGDAVEAALSRALEAAAAAGRFDVVAQLARELEARRLAGSPNVVTLPKSSRGR